MSIRVQSTALVLVILTASPVLAEPPFWGTVWLSRDVITTADPTGLRSVEYTGRGERVIWDYRELDWVTVDAYLFVAQIYDYEVEFQINPEFGSEEAARNEVDVYAPTLGRLPNVLISRLRAVHVNAGADGVGGNWHDQSITIHTDDGRKTLGDGFFEEALFHEGTHVSVEGLVKETPEWRAAQAEDGDFISNYARDYPDREDVAESLLTYFIVRFRPNRVTAVELAAIEEAIPNRILYFDGLALDWSPYPPAVLNSNQPPVAVGALRDVQLPELRATRDVDVSRAFDDPDGDTLTYVVSSSSDVITVTAVGGRVTLTAVSLGTAEIRVVATDPGGLSATQSFTVTVAAGSAPFADDPLRPGVTPIRAVHFMELRTRIGALRAALGLAPFRWTDPVLRAGITRVGLAHLLELREALGAAYAAAGRAAPPWTDAAPVVGSTPIRAAHLMELRAAVIALE